MEIPDILRSVDYYIQHVTYNISMNACGLNLKKYFTEEDLGFPLYPP